MRWLLLSSFAVAILSPAAAYAAPLSKAAAQADIWAKEQVIYRERGHGNMQAYIDGTARDYLAWPPFRTEPAGVDRLDELKKKMKVDNKEILTMVFKDFSMNGDAAVIYYQTHRTRLPDGLPADEYFDVIHSWVWQDGAWKVLGGMARATPKHP